MTWDLLTYIGPLCIVLWIAGAVAAWKNKKIMATVLTLIGFAGIAVCVGRLWITLDRPPLRTMGETRLWYSLLLPLAGVFIYSKWHYKWILSFTTILASVFLLINIFKPEIHSKALMPALQSPWFAPHVIVYMMAYAMMGAAFVVAVYLLFVRKKVGSYDNEMQMVDNMVNISYAFLTLGMLMGALWAKEAWGHYWSWDPKETWAAITWLSYLVYIHYRQTKKGKPKLALCMIVITFCLLQMCWWGVNYLPSAQGVSVHTYSMQ